MKIEEALKMKQFESPQQKALLNVIFTGYWLSEHMNEILKPFGLSEQQFNVLRILRGQKEKTLNLLDIQCRMMHKMSNATRLVEKLRQKGYVNREICPNNRRMVDINITEKGLQLLDKLDIQVKEHYEHFVEKLSVEEFDQLSELLDKIRS